MFMGQKLQKKNNKKKQYFLFLHDKKRNAHRWGDWIWETTPLTCFSGKYVIWRKQCVDETSKPLHSLNDVQQTAYRRDLKAIGFIELCTKSEILKFL